MSDLPLSGIRVLDLSRLLPGPLCSLMLADLGAEVLKVEDPVGGDYVRWLPPHIKNESAFFMFVNRGKKSMKLNLKAEEGREIFKKLAKNYDVVLESFRPGVMDKLGVGYDVLKKINPGIILCAISGYGADGPYRDKAGHDLNYISIAGLQSVTGTRNGAAVMPGFQAADIGGGSMYAAIGILAALQMKAKTGRGQFVDVSMMEGAMTFLTPIMSSYFAQKTPPARGREHLTGGLICYNVYNAKDGDISLGALEPKFWQEFCRLVNRPDLVDEQMADGDNYDRVYAEVNAIFKAKTKKEWAEFFKGKDVCCEPVNRVEELENDPQIAARQAIIELDHPTEGKYKSLRFPVRFSESGGYRKEPPPGFGEHTAEVLKSIGYGEEKIKELEGKKVI